MVVILTLSLSLPDSKPLTDAISQAGETFRDIGQMHAEQVSKLHIHS